MRYTVFEAGCLLAAIFILAANSLPARADYEAGAAAFSRGDWATAYREWRPLADAGQPAAQNNLGFLYRYGRGVPLDMEKAVGWYRRAAEKNHAAAQFNLGLMYDNGLGVAQDFKIAAMWLGRASKQGIARAQTFLGMMYWTGKGVPQDRVRALGWTLRASTQKDPPAILNERRFMKEMTPDEIARAVELANMQPDAPALR